MTEGTDAQATVIVRMEEDGKIATGQSADTDTVVASAKAYVNALNRLIVRRETLRSVTTPRRSATRMWADLQIQVRGAPAGALYCHGFFADRSSLRLSCDRATMASTASARCTRSIAVSPRPTRMRCASSNTSAWDEPRGGMKL